MYEEQIQKDMLRILLSAAACILGMIVAH